MKKQMCVILLCSKMSKYMSENFAELCKDVLKLHFVLDLKLETFQPQKFCINNIK